MAGRAGAQIVLRTVNHPGPLSTEAGTVCVSRGPAAPSTGQRNHRNTLKARNHELEEQQKDMTRRTSILQADMQSMKAQPQAQTDTSHVHATKMSQASGVKDQMAAKPSRHWQLV